MISFRDSGILSHIKEAGIYFRSLYLDDWSIWPSSHSGGQTKGIFVCISWPLIIPLAFKLQGWDQRKRREVIFCRLMLRAKHGQSSWFLIVQCHLFVLWDTMYRGINKHQDHSDDYVCYPIHCTSNSIYSLWFLEAKQPPPQIINLNVDSNPNSVSPGSAGNLLCDLVR